MVGSKLSISREVTSIVCRKPPGHEAQHHGTKCMEQYKKDFSTPLQHCFNDSEPRDSAVNGHRKE